MPPHPLTNFEIQKYYQNEPRFNGVYSRDNLPKIKDGAYIINLDEHYDTGTHWIALWTNNNNVTYFDSFGVQHIPKEIKEFINCRSLNSSTSYRPLSSASQNRNIITNIFRIQASDSIIICGYFCIGIFDFMLAGKELTDYTNLFSPHDFKKMI